MKLPVIVIFDVDGTLIGDVQPLLTFWLSIKDILHFDVVQEKIKGHLPAFIRPGLPQLMNAIKKKYQHAEFFIYSAGREEWLDVIIPCIEDILGVSFNRPLFGRGSCIIGYKMIECVAMNLLRIIKSKYIGNYSLDNIRDMVVIFDDNPAVYDDTRDFARVIRCPTFTSKKTVNVIEELGVDFCRMHYAHFSRMYFCKEMSSYESFGCEYEKYMNICKSVIDDSDFFGQLDLDEVDKILFPN